MISRRSVLHFSSGNRGGSMAAVTSKLELPAVNYYHKELHLGRCSSPISASGKSKTRVTISELRVTSLYLRVKSSTSQFALSLPRITGLNLQDTIANLRVTISNPRVKSWNLQVTSPKAVLKTRVGILKIRAEAYYESNSKHMS